MRPVLLQVCNESVMSVIFVRLFCNSSTLFVCAVLLRCDDGLA